MNPVVYPHLHLGQGEMVLESVNSEGKLLQ
jgi:hypothetical protein